MKYQMIKIAYAVIRTFIGLTEMLLVCVVLFNTDTAAFQFTTDTVNVTNQLSIMPLAAFPLLPINNDTLKSDTTTFYYTRSMDENDKLVTYILHIFGNGIEATFVTSDTAITVGHMKQAFGYGKTYCWTVSAVKRFDTTESRDTFKFTTPIYKGGIIGTGDNPPSPFSPSTSIIFGLPFKSSVIIKIYDSAGRCVRDVDIGTKLEGRCEVKNIDLSDLTSGLYFYRIKAVSVDGFNKYYSVAKKMILMK
jgi:hypothetical protein